MKEKLFGIIILLFIATFPAFAYSTSPVSVVFKNYTENIRVYENNSARAILSITIANSFSESLLIPISVDYEQISIIKPANAANIVSVINIEGKTYLAVEPRNLQGIDSKSISIEIEIKDFLKEEGLFFKNKSIRIPIITNYPNTSKNNIFIDNYNANIEIPSTLKLNDNYRTKSASLFNLKVISTSPEKQNLVLSLSANYLNLHAIQHEPISFTAGFNLLILAGIILGLLALYLVYFSNLLSFRDPRENESEIRKKVLS